MKKNVSFIVYANVVINTDNDLFEEYNSIEEIIDDAVSYKFSSVCPAINQRLIEIEDLNHESIEVHETEMY